MATSRHTKQSQVPFGEKKTDFEAESGYALIQDCAADFGLARQISGHWKIIWSWLWEVVRSGRRAGDVGRRFEG